ncbi:MAG: alpha/beta superfamily hydrolase [Candidatus Omnitrophota bacterium]|jgi:alpha/beta superfamily hydrolase
MIEEVVAILSGDLKLEGVLSYKEDLKIPGALTLILSPHPFLGGDMNNNVIKAISKVVAEAGHVALRFNYRGMGNSQCDIDLKQNQKEFWDKSTCPEYEQKIHLDSIAAYQYLIQAFDDIEHQNVLGYSFGCLPALDLGYKYVQIKKVFLVAPPIAKWDIPNTHLQMPKHKLIYYAPGDFACPEDELQKIYQTLSEPKNITRINAGDHFFIGHENELTCQIAESL